MNRSGYCWTDRWLRGCSVSWSRRERAKFRLLDIVLEELTRTVEDSAQVRAIHKEDNA
ncbi:MAG: hypothetical protein ISN28_13330 [Ectothiorhodospiraceae bacterium AqS1]|nr:hypothetical protein [Ectothiorhodospiraceae bacterium AqS1]